MKMNIRWTIPILSAIGVVVACLGCRSGASVSEDTPRLIDPWQMADCERLLIGVQVLDQYFAGDTNAFIQDLELLNDSMAGYLGGRLLRGEETPEGFSGLGELMLLKEHRREHPWANEDPWVTEILRRLYRDKDTGEYRIDTNRPPTCATQDAQPTAAASPPAGK